MGNSSMLAEAIAANRERYFAHLEPPYPPRTYFAVPRKVKFQMRGTRSRVLRRLVGAS